MGNCVCLPRRKKSSGDSEIHHVENEVSNWVAASDFSSVPEEEVPAPTARVDESPEETVYRPAADAIQITAPADGYTTAPEDEAEEEEEAAPRTPPAAEDGSSDSVESEYLTSDEQEKNEETRMSPARPNSQPLPVQEDSTDEDELTPQIVLNGEDQPVRPLPTPLRKFSMSPRTLEKVTYKNGRANKSKLNRVIQLRQEAAAGQ